MKAAFFTAAFVVVVIIVIAVFSFFFIKTDREIQQAKVCDEVVPIFQTTNDMVELRRSIFVIKWLECSVSSRWK